MRTMLAFVLGAVLAAGTAYVVMKDKRAPEPPPSAAVTAPAEPAPTVAVPAETVPTVPPPAAVPATPARPAPASPAPRHAKRPETRPTPPRPVEVAQNTNPAPAASPAPTSAPAASEPYRPETPVPHSEPAPAPPVEKPEPPKPATVTIPAGTLLGVRLGQTLSTDRDMPGDTFMASLSEPLIVDGFEIARRGARVEGRIVESDRGGRVRGVSNLSVHLTKLTTADGQKININTEVFAKQATSSVGKDAAKVGAASAIGAAIGAIAGGGKGAAIGAGVGGAAGAGGVMATRGKAAEIPVETKLSFKLAEPVTITERR